MHKDEQKPVGINIGSASIIMIFAVLCLTVFSALSLTTAVSEKSTADKYAAATADYYVADSAAEVKRAQIAEQMKNGGPGSYFEYAVPIGDGSTQLSVAISYASGSEEIKLWQITDVSEWSPDNSIEVLDTEKLAKEAQEK